MEINSPVTHLALSGGIGGAKLALGLEYIFKSTKLMIAGNTGDDFEHFGLNISPDLDTLLYTLSGKSDLERGWGLANETWSFMKAMKEIGGETWFQLGDRDLAIHVERTRRLKEGERLSLITSSLCRKFGVKSHIVPATDDSLKTLVKTPKGILSFQQYFVRDQCRPKILGLKYEGLENAQPCPALKEALESSLLETVVVCPSNPFLSIDPILAVKGVREKLKSSNARVLAVSPIVGGDAVKGPTANNLRDLGFSVSAYTIAKYYSDFIDGFMLDKGDENEISRIESLGMQVGLADTVMTDLQSKIKLAEDILRFSKTL